MNKTWIFIVLIPICLIVLIVVVLSWTLGDVILDYGRYFAVSDSGNLYLGVDQSIHIYSDSSLVKTFLVGRGCSFTISGDEIIVDNGVTTFRYTLDGEEIGSEKGNPDIIFRQYRYIAEDGTEYRIRYPWGRFSVYNETSHEIVYQMPLRDYLYGLAGVVAMTYLACFGLFLMLKWMMGSS